MNAKRKWLKDSLRLGRNLILEQRILLACLIALSCFLNIMTEDMLQGSSIEENSRWVLQLGLGLWDLCENILLILILSWALPNARRITEPSLLEQPFTTPYLGSFFGEYLRVLAQILMWGLLLIIPGIFRYFQLIFVAFITLFSREYRAGKVDALKLSETLAKGRMGQIFMALALTTAVQLVFEFSPQLLDLLHNYPVRILVALINSLVAVWGYSLIYLLFEQAMSEAGRTHE